VSSFPVRLGGAWGSVLNFPDSAANEFDSFYSCQKAHYTVTIVTDSQCLLLYPAVVHSHFPSDFQASLRIESRLQAASVCPVGDANAAPRVVYN